MPTEKECDDLRAEMERAQSEARMARATYRVAAEKWWLDHLALTPNQTVVIVSGRPRMLFIDFDPINFLMKYPGGNIIPTIRIRTQKKNGDWGAAVTRCDRGWRVENDD